MNQTLLALNAGVSTTNIASNNPPYNKTSDLQPTQDVNPNAIHTQTNTKSTHLYRAWSTKDNIMHPVAAFEQTKQIIMDIDALLHSPALCNQILQALNLNDLYKYDNLHKAYLFENPKKPVNWSYILVFLKQSACYAIIPGMYQWYRINT